MSEIGRPQKAILDVADRSRITGSILDSGCGTGENAHVIAGRGQTVTGFDFLAELVSRVKRKAEERGLTATFHVMDALALNDLPEVFDAVIDSVLFQVLLARRPAAVCGRVDCGPEAGRSAVSTVLKRRRAGRSGAEAGVE